ncbi:class I SAM-dependent methyltransferase [uncultured Marinobacter sp.]|uniref:class I SAM-dependent methyltransferase n=1 Tax=uncultured Marinobacter sp. TaxID=187379 RepID=UPI00261B2302|nr:class I SAM-dependent methyltransferase [uncultured Marinobacter sp.]
MSHLSVQELEKVAEAYEQLLAPALFEQWADRLADAAEIQPGQRVLDVACGTGILARTLASRVGESGAVSGVDINPGMLAVAKRNSPGIEWQEGSAEALPYDDDQFDAVLCQLGLMLFSAPETALREMKRVLKPGGHLALAVFGSFDQLPAYATMASIYERLIDPGVGNALQLPFSMGNKDRLASLFEEAGIQAPVIITHEGTAHFDSVRNMVLADIKGWFPFAGIELGESATEAVVKEASKELASFQTSQGAVEFKLPVHFITATKA